MQPSPPPPRISTLVPYTPLFRSPKWGRLPHDKPLRGPRTPERPEQRPDPRPERPRRDSQAHHQERLSHRPEPPPARSTATPPGDVGPSPEEEMDERFKTPGTSTHRRRGHRRRGDGEPGSGLKLRAHHTALDRAPSELGARAPAVLEAPETGDRLGHLGQRQARRVRARGPAAEPHLEPGRHRALDLPGLRRLANAAIGQPLEGLRALGHRGEVPP